MAADRFGHATRVDVEFKRTTTWTVFAKLVGLRIRAMRKIRDISAVELAAALGSSLRVIRRWESGTNPPHLSTLLAISIALRCSIADLLPGADAIAGAPVIATFVI